MTDDEPRPVVQAFAQRMESKLRANDHRGGWDSESTEWLLARLYEEVAELALELNRYDDPPATRASRIAHEAADVANFAMMLADVCGGLNR